MRIIDLHFRTLLYALVVSASSIVIFCGLKVLIVLCFPNSLHYFFTLNAPNFLFLPENLAIKNE